MGLFRDPYILAIYGIFCVLAIFVFFIVRYDRRKKENKKEEFYVWIERMKKDSCEETAVQFLCFIKSYQGGAFKKEKIRTCKLEYDLHEKQELEYLFYQNIAPAHQIKQQTKEEIQNWLCLEVGILCLLQPPHYDKKEELDKII